MDYDFAMKYQEVVFVFDWALKTGNNIIDNVFYYPIFPPNYTTLNEGALQRGVLVANSTHDRDGYTYFPNPGNINESFWRRSSNGETINLGHQMMYPVYNPQLGRYEFSLTPPLSLPAVQQEMPQKAREMPATASTAPPLVSTVLTKGPAVVRNALARLFSGEPAAQPAAPRARSRSFSEGGKKKNKKTRRHKSKKQKKSKSKKHNKSKSKSKKSTRK